MIHFVVEIHTNELHRPFDEIFFDAKNFSPNGAHIFTNQTVINFPWLGSQNHGWKCSMDVSISLDPISESKDIIFPAASVFFSFAILKASASWATSHGAVILKRNAQSLKVCNKQTYENSRSHGGSLISNVILYVTP